MMNDIEADYLDEQRRPGPRRSFLCECCVTRLAVKTVRYTDGGPMLCCEVCEPELIENGAEIES